MAFNRTHLYDVPTNRRLDLDTDWSNTHPSLVCTSGPMRGWALQIRWVSILLRNGQHESYKRTRIYWNTIIDRTSQLPRRLYVACRPRRLLLEGADSQVSLHRLMVFTMDGREFITNSVSTGLAGMLLQRLYQNSPVQEAACQ